MILVLDNNSMSNMRKISESLKFVSNGLNNKALYVHVMGWRRIGKPLPEPLTRMRHCPQGLNVLSHRGRVTHVCVGKITFIGSDNGLSPGRRQAIIWINTGILLIVPLETNFSEIQSKLIHFNWRKCIGNYHLRNCGHCVQGGGGGGGGGGGDELTDLSSMAFLSPAIHLFWHIQGKTYEVLPLQNWYSLLGHGDQNKCRSQQLGSRLN